MKELDPIILLKRSQKVEVHLRFMLSSETQIKEVGVTRLNDE